jgi:hypothetical protein
MTFNEPVVLVCCDGGDCAGVWWMPVEALADTPGPERDGEVRDLMTADGWFVDDHDRHLCQECSLQE